VPSSHFFFEMCDQNPLRSRHATRCARFLSSSPHFVAEFSLLIRHYSCNIFMQKQPVDSRTATIVEAERFCAANFLFAGLPRVVCLRCLNRLHKESYPWNGPRLSTKRSTSTARSALTPTQNFSRRLLAAFSFDLRNISKRPGFRPAFALPECSLSAQGVFAAQFETTDQPFPCTLEF
jgi:hypothetical protein